MKKLDVIVCPAQEWGIKDVLFKQKRWYSISIHDKRKEDLKFLAIYEKKPVKAIRYVGKIKKIQPHGDLGHYEILLEGKIKKIKPIKRSKNSPHLAPQSRQYTLKKLLDNAEWLEDIFGKKLQEELHSDLAD